MGQLVSCASYLNNEAGLNGFREFLHQHRNIPIYLIADAVEEDYRTETMPHTMGASRQALLERKLGQIYRNTSYRAAYFLGREKDRRRDDIFLLLALNNAECINPWVLAIQEQHAPLAGIYLLPMVSQYLFERLKLNVPHALLTDIQASGFRQTYFHEGKLRVSRLVPTANREAAQLSTLYATETEKTRLYLLSQRLITRETRLSLLVLSPGHEGDAICRQIGDEQNLECIALDAIKLAKRFGLGEAMLRQFPELLYMQVLAKGCVPVSLAPQSHRKAFWVHQLRVLLGATSVVVLLAGLVMSALNVLRMLDYSGQVEEARAETLRQERLYNEVAKNFPATPLPGSDLQTAVEISQAVVEHAHTPRQLMMVAATALDQAPDIALQRLRWKLTDDLNVKDETSPTGAPVTPDQGIGSMTGAVQGAWYDIGFLEGEIRNFTGDYRAALASVTRLAELIRKDERVAQVLIIQQPVNVSSLTDLSGTTLDAQAEQIPAARFKLKVVLKPQVNTP